MSFTAVRTIPVESPSSGNESAPAAGSAWVSIDRAPMVEFRCSDFTWAGDPTGVTIYYWRRVGPTIDYLGSQTITKASADAGRIQPQLFDSYASQFYATVGAFNGGTAPTVAMTVSARPLIL